LLQARETISISKRNLMAHAHGHEHSKEHDESDEHGEEHDASDTQATTAKKAGWKKLRAWVNQPLVNIAHVLHLDEEEQEHDVAHLRADGVFAWDSPHFAFQCCSATCECMLCCYLSLVTVASCTQLVWSTDGTEETERTFCFLCLREHACHMDYAHHPRPLVSLCN
jgi:hypothetical protein